MRIPLSAVYAPVSDKAFRLFCVLRSCADGSGVTYMYRAELADALGCVKSTVDRCARELVKAGLLSIEHADTDAGSPDANRWLVSS